MQEQDSYTGQVKYQKCPKCGTVYNFDKGVCCDVDLTEEYANR